MVGSPAGGSGRSRLGAGPGDGWPTRAVCELLERIRAAKVQLEAEAASEPADAEPRDAAHQVIVAHRPASNPAGFAALVPLVDPARHQPGCRPREGSDDTELPAGRVLKRKPLMQAQVVR